MSLRVVMTQQAEREMQSAFNWWASHRSKPQADRRYTGLAEAIAGLSENPERHGQSKGRGTACLFPRTFEAVTGQWRSPSVNSQSSYSSMALFSDLTTVDSPCIRSSIVF